jgi:hypothetical protein
LEILRQEGYCRMNKDNFKKEIDMQKINKIIKKTAEEVVIELKNKDMLKKDSSYYKRVELLLYNYENLKDAVDQKDEAIKDIELNGLPQSSKSIVVYSSTSGNITAEDRFIQLKEKYLLEKLETQRDLNRIETALDKIRKDKYYDIIKIKYLENNGDKISDELIAEKMKKDQSTITRNRKRLMNKLITIFFPESLRDFA